MELLLYGQALQTCIWACLTRAVKLQEGFIQEGHFWEQHTANHLSSWEEAGAVGVKGMKTQAEPQISP